MERVEEKMQSVRESLMSVQVPWWPVFFWLFVGQLVHEGIMVGLDEWSRLSAMGLDERIRFIKSEISDDVLISAVVSMILVDIGRYLMITAGWFKNLVDRNIAAYEDKIRAKVRNEALAEGLAEGRAEVLGVLDEDTRKEAECKLRRNGDSATRN